MDTKSASAKTMGLRSFDTALPQVWLDQLVSQVTYSRETASDNYDILRAGLVWCYDGSISGYPVAVTPKAAYLLSRVIRIKE